MPAAFVDFGRDLESKTGYNVVILTQAHGENKISMYIVNQTQEVKK